MVEGEPSPRVEKKEVYQWAGALWNRSQRSGAHTHGVAPTLRLPSWQCEGLKPDLQKAGWICLAEGRDKASLPLQPSYWSPGVI